MNSHSSDQLTSHDAVFASLRAKACREVCGSAMLLALLQTVSKMEESQTEPRRSQRCLMTFSRVRADERYLAGFLISLLLSAS